MNKHIKYDEEQLDNMINFQQSYNQQQFLKNQHNKNNHINKSNQKFSIMEDFNQIYQKIVKQNNQYLNNNQNLTNGKKELENQKTNFLGKYYAQLKETRNDTMLKYQVKEQINNDNKTIMNNKIDNLTNNKDANNNIKNNQIKLMKNSFISTKPIKNQEHIVVNQSIKKVKVYPLTLNKLNNQKNFTSLDYQQTNKNTENNQQQVKRDYYSVQDKIKIIQQSKLFSNNQRPSLQLNPNNPIKDYYGQQNNFVNRKIHGKNFINSKDRNLIKNQVNANKEIKKDFMTKYINQNNSIQANKIQQRSQMCEKKYEQQYQTFKKPTIILYKKIVDLTQNTQSIIDAFKNQQMKNDYAIFNQSQSLIQEGLFAKAIVNQRATKTVQNVQFSSTSGQILQHAKKDRKQQFISSSPIHNKFGSNSSAAYNSIFQKRQSYLR